MGGREAEGCSWLPELRQWPGSRVGPAARAGGRLPVSAGGEDRQAGEEKAGKEQGAASGRGACAGEWRPPVQDAVTPARERKPWNVADGHSWSLCTHIHIRF